MKVDWDKQEVKAKKILEKPEINPENKGIIVHVAKRMLSLLVPICSSEVANLTREEAHAVLDIMGLALDIEYADLDGNLINAPDGEIKKENVVN